MKAYISLHTEKPNSQLCYEVSYAGYHRIEIECEGDLIESLSGKTLDAFFPVVEEDSNQILTWIGIGPFAKGQGELFMRVPTPPMMLNAAPEERQTEQFWTAQGVPPAQAAEYINKYAHFAPHVVIGNTDGVPALPSNLNPIARVAHNLVYAGLMNPSELHPKLYEAINDALHYAGVPVLRVERGGTATMEGKFSDLRLSDWECMIQTATWLPPSLCGCQIQLTADWANADDIANGQTYRHPKPFTITNAQIISVCAGHTTVSEGSMPDVSSLYETDPISGQSYQRRGYLQHTIAGPTPAQVLYQHLCFHKGQTHSYPCGCSAHMWGDQDGNYTYLIKAGVTQKCLQHQNDTIDMQQAAADFNAQMAAAQEPAASD